MRSLLFLYQLRFIFTCEKNVELRQKKKMVQMKMCCFRCGERPCVYGGTASACSTTLQGQLSVVFKLWPFVKVAWWLSRLEHLFYNCQQGSCFRMCRSFSVILLCHFTTKICWKLGMWKKMFCLCSKWVPQVQWNPAFKT